MSRHLKSVIKDRLKGIISYYAPHSEISASHRRGVRYIVPIECYDGYWGAMNTVKEGLHYKKHIIVRRVPRGRARLLQLYTYHFPKSWSAACVANRELIKEAQRRAHALEHDHSLAALEWRIRFFHHYYTVFIGGAKPEPGMKPYSYFYQYTYVAIYRELKAAQKQAEEVSFEPVSDTPHISHPVSANEILSPLLRRNNRTRWLRSKPFPQGDSAYTLSEAYFREGVLENPSSRGRVTPKGICAIRMV